MENKLKLATILTVVGMVIYSTILLSFTNKTESSLVLLNFNPPIIIPLSFKVSLWWNLLFFPLIFIIFSYYYEESNIIGIKPNTNNQYLKDKFSTRKRFFRIKYFTIFCSFFSVVLQFVVIFLWKKELLGPMSSLACGAYIFINIFLGISFLNGLGLIFENFFSSERKAIDIYKSFFVCFAKIGFIKTIPIIFGLTIGLFLRYPIEVIYRFFMFNKRLSKNSH